MSSGLIEAFYGTRKSAGKKVKRLDKDSEMTSRFRAISFGRSMYLDLQKSAVCGYIYIYTYTNTICRASFDDFRILILTKVRRLPRLLWAWAVKFGISATWIEGLGFSVQGSAI